MVDSDPGLKPSPTQEELEKWAGKMLELGDEALSQEGSARKPGDFSAAIAAAFCSSPTSEDSEKSE